MTWFTNLFGDNEKPEREEQQGKTVNEPGSLEAPFISEDIFLDNTPPVEAQEATKLKKENRLAVFLRENYEAQGYRDGYNYHSQDILINRKKAMKAEFRELVDQLIDEKRAEILTLQNHKVETEGLSDRLAKQLENRIAELQHIVTRLENEKVFSVDDEGLVMRPIHNYSDGFLRGFEDYQMEKLLAGSTGLFN